jgi:long-subunit fatty acid transport protein
MGMGIGAAISKETANDGDVYTDIVATFSPFARYYINPANNLSLFFEGSLGLGIGTSEYDPDYGEATKDILSVVTIGLTPALSYKISDNFSLEAAVGGLSYSTMNLTDNDDSDIKTTVSGFGLNFGLDNLTFGAIFKL